MRKVLYSFLFVFAVFSVAWYFVGQFGKQVVTAQLNSIKNLSYKKVSLGGYPFSFKYSIQSPALKDAKNSDESDISSEEFVVKVDLLTQNFLFLLNKPIQINSDDNKLNYRISLDKKSYLKLSTKKPFFVRYMNDENSNLINFIKDYSASLYNLKVYDNNLDKNVFNMPSTRFSVSSSVKEKIDNVNVDFYFNAKGDDDLNFMDSGDLTIDAKLNFQKFKKDFKLIDVKKFNINAKEFSVKALGSIDFDEQTSSMNSIKTIFNIPDEYINSTPKKLRFILRYLFLVSSDNPNSTEMPINVNITNFGDNIYFGKNSLITLPFFTMQLSEQYNQMIEALNNAKQEELTSTEEKQDDAKSEDSKSNESSQSSAEAPPSLEDSPSTEKKMTLK
jgi:hypothetical protein